jgi:hypothetical protein
VIKDIIIYMKGTVMPLAASSKPLRKAFAEALTCTKRY